MNKKLAINLGIIVVLLISAITIYLSNSQHHKSTELIISAAASLQDSLKEIQTDYEANHSGIKLTFNYGSSGTLQHQIEQGAPADLFLSAGSSQMNKLVNGGFIDAAQQTP